MSHSKARSPQNDRATSRFLARFPTLWGLLTLVYVFAVVYRAIAFNVLPGFASLAACLAITAVWVDIQYITHRFLQLRYIVAGLVGMTMLTNLLIVVIALGHGRSAPLGRLIAALFFAFVLHEQVVEITIRRNT